MEVGFSKDLSHWAWSVDGPNGFLSAKPMPGFGEWDTWRANLPPQLHTAVQALVDLAARLPALCVTEGRFLKAVEAKQEALEPLRHVARLLPSFHESEVAWEAGREWLMIVLTCIAAGLRASGGTEKLPRVIENPLKVLSKACGRLSHIDFTELVLGNWTCTPSKPGPLSTATSAGEQPYTNGTPRERMQVVWSFLASPDEEWYRNMHLILNAEARDAIAAIRLGQHSTMVQDDRGVMRSLESLAIWLNKMCDFFDAHFEQKDSRTEVVSMSRLAKFVAQSWFTASVYFIRR